MSAHTTPHPGGPVKVLHVAETAQGGVGSYLEEIVPVQAARHGADSVRVVLPREHAAHFKRLPPTLLQTFEIAGARRMRCMLRMAGVVWALVRRWRPDVVHVHSTYAGFVLRPLLALLPDRPRVVYCAHGWAFDRRAPDWLNRTVASVERIWARWSDAIVCISRHDHDSALRAGIAARRLSVIVNGIGDLPRAAADAPPAGRWPAAALRVLFVGRLDRQKGVDVLYEALRRLGDRAAAVVVGSAVVADGPAAEPPPNVHVTGWLSRDQIGALYEAAQVLVVPSRWEGFGLVALEAMRCGRAVVASRVGGLPEVVQDGVSGALFEPEDAAALADVLASLSEARLHAMGRAGRQRFETRFHIGRVADELDTLYRALLAGVGRRGSPQGAT
jgi:glycosyltransferase involved in cell wall biosynthesis